MIFGVESSLGVETPHDGFAIRLNAIFEERPGTFVFFFFCESGSKPKLDGGWDFGVSVLSTIVGDFSLQCCEVFEVVGAANEKGGDLFTIAFGVELSGFTKKWCCGFVALDPIVIPAEPKFGRGSHSDREIRKGEDFALSLREAFVVLFGFVNEGQALKHEAFDFWVFGGEKGLVICESFAVAF